MSYRFFCCVWGDQHADMYERVALPSLMQSKNRASIPPSSTLALYSDEKTMARVRDSSVGPWLIEPVLIDAAEDSRTVQNKAIAREIKRCLETNSTLVMVNPDHFWGNGSLGNLIKLAAGRDICVAAPHPRVERNAFLNLLPKHDVDNAELVALAVDTFHRSWRDANTALPKTNTFATGASISPLGNGLFAVSHVIPTIFLARFQRIDAEFFSIESNNGGTGTWDHFWPELLIGMGRQRYIGSSDLFFAVELTDADTHLSDTYPLDRAHPDRYFRDSPMIRFNLGMTAVWRCN